MEYEPIKNNGVGVMTPNFISFQTQQNQFPGFFRSTGVFQIGRSVLGTINISGTFVDVP